MKVSVGCLAPGADDDIPRAGYCGQKRANSLAEQSFHKITFDGQLRDTFTDHEADARTTCIVGSPCKDKQPGRKMASLLPHSLELTTFPQSRCTSKRHKISTQAPGIDRGNTRPGQPKPARTGLDSQLPAPLGAASFQHAPTVAGRHTFHKTMYAQTRNTFRLPGPFHNPAPLPP